MAIQFTYSLGKGTLTFEVPDLSSALMIQASLDEIFENQKCPKCKGKAFSPTVREITSSRDGRETKFKKISLFCKKCGWGVRTDLGTYTNPPNPMIDLFPTKKWFIADFGAGTYVIVNADGTVVSKGSLSGGSVPETE